MLTQHLEQEPIISLTVTEEKGTENEGVGMVVDAGRRLDNKPIYLATFLSFIYAFGHFLTEFMIYHTMAISNLTTVGIFADMSILSLVAPKLA
ncbi:hypothetical protein K1719_021925 [Acacia pycnantha]|nr:hypothetical protein K1719_021925 [Acacia pycnantha]